MSEERTYFGRVIFVGIHNKRGKLPLCTSTKTGKMITRIKAAIAPNYVVRTNLCDIEEFPSGNISDHNTDWYYAHLPSDSDVIVLLGAWTHKNFDGDFENVLKVAHPASKRSHVAMDAYVDSVSGKILGAIQKIMTP